MSVHDADYNKIKDELGIPHHEPIFIIRGNDDLAAAIVARYCNMANQIENPEFRPSEDWFDEMARVVNEFQSYRANYPDKIKVPD